ASLAVVEAITEICGERGIAATIKWPNDVLSGDRKVAGILVETSHDRAGHMVAIVGIGVNVNGQLTSEQVAMPEMATATTLEMAYGQPISREIFLAALLRHIEAYYLALQQEVRSSSMTAYVADTRFTSRLVQEKWRSYLSTLGRRIQVHQGDTVLDGIAE